MRKLTLNVDALNVQSFATAPAAKAQGTVYGHAPTNGNNTDCLSAVDACPTGFCAPTYDAACQDTTLCTAVDCPKTYDCPSAYDACPSQRGCF
jgi:hypothetical protein